VSCVRGTTSGCCEVSATAPPTTKKARAGRPGFFCTQECERVFPQKHALGLGPRVDTGFAIRMRANRMVSQAAGLNSFDALALIGSTVSVATFWVNSASSLVWAVNASNCLRA